MNDEKTSRLVLMNAMNLLVRGYIELNGNIEEAIDIMEFVIKDYKTSIQSETNKVDFKDKESVNTFMGNMKNDFNL